MKKLILIILVLFTSFFYINISSAYLGSYYDPINVRIKENPLDKFIQQIENERIMQNFNQKILDEQRSYQRTQQQDMLKATYGVSAYLDCYYETACGRGLSGGSPPEKDRCLTSTKQCLERRQIFKEKSSMVDNSLLIPVKTPDQICREYGGINSVWSGNKNNDGGHICNCKSGFQWNTDGTHQCVPVSVKTPDQICQNEYGDNSVWTGKNNDKGGLICDCKSGYWWNETNTQCVARPIKTNDQICQEAYGANSKWDGTVNNQGQLNCGCKNDYWWNDIKTMCVFYGTGNISTDSSDDPVYKISLLMKQIEELRPQASNPDGVANNKIKELMKQIQNLQLKLSQDNSSPKNKNICSKSPIEVEVDNNIIFSGDGRDGSWVTIPDVRLARVKRDTYYKDLTISKGTILDRAGYNIYVSGTFTNNGALVSLPEGMTENFFNDDSSLICPEITLKEKSQDKVIEKKLSKVDISTTTMELFKNFSATTAPSMVATTVREIPASDLISNPSSSNLLYLRSFWSKFISWFGF